MQIPPAKISVLRWHWPLSAVTLQGGLDLPTQKPTQVPGWSQPNQHFQVYKDPWEKSSGLPPPFPHPSLLSALLGFVWKQGGQGEQTSQRVGRGCWICLDFLIVIIFSCRLWLKMQKLFFPTFKNGGVRVDKLSWDWEKNYLKKPTPNQYILHPHLSAWLLSSEYFALWFAGIVCTGLWSLFVAFHVHTDQEIQDQYSARLHVGMCIATKDKSHCWDHLILLLLGISCFHPLLHKPPCPCPWWHSLIPHRVLWHHRLGGIGKDSFNSLGNKCHGKRLLYMEKKI